MGHTLAVDISGPSVSLAREVRSDRCGVRVEGVGVSSVGFE